MTEVDPGHEFLLEHLDGYGTTRLTFVKREGDNYPGNIGHHEGTTTQEVLRALLRRQAYVNNQQPHPANVSATRLLRWVLADLEGRAAEKHGRLLPSSVYETPIEDLPVCPVCFHLLAWHKGGEHK